MSQKITAEDLYRSILFRAADIYEVEYEDVERDLGQQFDPIVRFMSGALASELERVYRHLDDTESRLQKRLARVLLPEHYHLPVPAHALATARPSSESLIIDEITVFETEFAEDDRTNICFTPVFPQKLLPAEVKMIATEKRLFSLGKRTKQRRKSRSAEGEEVSRVFVGFSAADLPVDWQGATLFFDLKSGDDAEKDTFFSAVPGSRVRLQGIELQPRKGIAQNELILEDYLNGNEKLQRQIRAYYEHHFLTFADSEIEGITPESARDFLQKKFAGTKTEKEFTEYFKSAGTAAESLLYRLEIDLAYPVSISNPATSLTVRFNVFPVVNRRLNGDKPGEHHYLRNNSIKWIALKPEEDFLAMRRVYEEKPPEYSLYTFKPFADFKEERKPSYTLRHGGVGRWDDYNAWQRLAYVVSILQDNYKHKELTEAAAGALSLEDVHRLLGKRISKTAVAEKPTRDIYVLLHAGVAAGMRVRTEYWTSRGEEANDISAKTILRCISKHKSEPEEETSCLLTAAGGGRAPLDSTQQLYALKSALLSRDRIVTREDVKVFCQSFLQEKAADIKITDGVGIDPRFNFGMTRLLEVNIRPATSAIKEDWGSLCRQIQKLLEAKSTSALPIRVQLMQETNAVTV